MRHLIFAEAPSYPIALLIKATCFSERELVANYLLPLEAAAIARNQVIGFTLDYDGKAKPTAKIQKAYLAHLLPALDRLGVKLIYCADAEYFKTLTKQKKSDPCYGYTYPCAIEGFEHMQVILGMNYQALIYNPQLQEKLDLSLKTLIDVVHGTYVALGQGIIHKAHYPESLDDIAAALDQLALYPELSCDIEAFGLRFHSCGIGTIAFGTDQHQGVAFAVDYRPSQEATDGLWGSQHLNGPVRNLLRQFFERYEGNLVWHGSTYDLRVLIYQLWMLHPQDIGGLLKGLDIMTRRFDDTRIVAYLATNSSADVSLKLKSLAHGFAGNWAQDEIKDIRRIPLPELLQYNLIDALATHYVKRKYWPVMVADNQETLYHTLMKPSLKVIIQMELIGMPMVLDEVAGAKALLETKQQEALATIMGHPLIGELNRALQTLAMNAANAKLKLKQHPLEHFADVVFNPNSGLQLQMLLYDLMELPVVDVTTTKQPATGADTLEKLVHHTTDPGKQAVLKALIEYGKVTKILTGFIPAFEEAVLKADGIAYLHGCFNLGGTVSGRLSSSDPNLQNLPAGSLYGKLIKSCFQAPRGQLFVGADFASLEDRINALLTKDPNKIKVYTDGFDGHCLRAYAYFGDQMPDIEPTVDSINSIAKRYPALRQDSKSPTFALTYLGTWKTMVKNLGWGADKAKRVEANYHKLYAASTAWVKAKIDQAAKDGYAEVAFGLRVRTPLLKQTVLGVKNTPQEAEAEARTLGNAVSGQSYGLLTNRAMNAFMERVWASPYRERILPVAMIHDAIYLLIDDDLEVVLWVNEHLIREMEWQELPEIQHDQVKLGAELDIFWPSWAEKLTIPNQCSKEFLKALALKHCKALMEKQAA